MLLLLKQLKSLSSWLTCSIKYLYVNKKVPFIVINFLQLTVLVMQFDKVPVYWSYKTLLKVTPW